MLASALHYVQEREEPVDFLDIFYDYEKIQDDLGITDDIHQFKMQKKNLLSPLKQKNQNNSHMNNSSAYISSALDHTSTRSNSVFQSSQNNRLQNRNTNNINNNGSIQNNNKQQNISKLSPIKIDKATNSPKRVGGTPIFQTSQSHKNLKNSLSATNSVKGIGLGLNNSIRCETSDLDNMYKSALFQNNFSRQRLQQIEFYSSQSQGPSKQHNNFFSTHQSSQYKDNNSVQHNELSNDWNNPYSLKNANHILKEHFNLQISSVPDTRKKYVLRKVNKPSSNHMASGELRKDGKMFKPNMHNHDFQQISTQTDETNAFDQVQQSTQSVKEQILFQSLKPSLGGFTGTPLGQNFSLSTLSSGSNQFINLNNLMISVNSPQFFFTQKQFFNQNSNFPRTAPSGPGETRKERGFQIKNFQNSNGANNINKPSTSSSSQTKIDSRQLYSRESYQKKKVKPEVNWPFKQNQFQDDHYRGVGSQKNQSNIQPFHKDDQNQMNSTKTQNQYNPYSNEMNFNASSQNPASLVDNNQNILPLFCLNFNKNLEKRLLLNSFGI